MNTLPDDVLCRCLARVPLADRVPAERVCKGWRTAFASKAYTVARRACAEPVWLVMGGRDGDGTGRVLDQCHVLDSSLQKVAQLAPRHSASAGSAVIPGLGVGLGVLVMGGHGENHQPTALRGRTAQVLNLQGGSVWGLWGGLLPDSCSKPSICALGESIYVDCCYNIHSDNFAESELLRYDKHGNLLETIQKPDAIREPLSCSCMHAINGRLFFLSRVDDQDSIYRLDSYDPATGEWRRMPDPPIQGLGLDVGATEHAGKLYVIGGNVLLTMGGRKLVADVRVFDGQVWSPGPPLPSPAVCYFAVSAGDRILVVVDNFRMAYVLHDGTWRSYSCDETEFVAFPYVVPLGSPAVAGHSA